ncbi:MAG: single-stranded-DNA-specific exonuclease RecJ [Candidatus Cloacimonadota bacterium]|nr:MAG: single-stranded-DNA-specific exonuclease RecJ [Candidatus Cloacimonadota bacterium]
MQKKWIFCENNNNEDVKRLAKKLNAPKIVANLLLNKGLHNSKEITQFFYPCINDLHDPYLFPDMEKAVYRVKKAIKNGERITIYGDYDVDGTTSIAILYLGLIEIIKKNKSSALIDYYIPNRMVDGYGLSQTGVEQLKKLNTNLVITVDCGINAIKEIDSINSSGMDVIVTDHHTPKEHIPNAFAVINPKLHNSTYPYKYLAGVGTAYKLLMAIYNEFGMDDEMNIMKYLDFVSMGTISDIVPLTGENRILASLGLKRLEKQANYGLSALMKLSGLNKQSIKSTDIVFKLAPRINAAGRMGSALRAVELMISNNEAQADRIAKIIYDENEKRKLIDQTTFIEACEMIEAKYQNLDDVYFIVISSENWHPGVIGIVASKIVEKYHRPTIMISFSEGEGNGSGRSIRNFDIFSALLQCENLLSSFGGHKYAAGISILPEYVEQLEEMLNQIAKEQLTKEDLLLQIKISAKLDLSEIDKDLIQWLKLFAPFGPQNMRPVFWSEKVMVVGYPYIVGNNHLKLKVMKNGNILETIGFNLGDYRDFISKGDIVNIAYTLEENTWMDKVTIQGNLKDIKLAN